MDIATELTALGLVSFRKPTKEELRVFLDQQADQPASGAAAHPEAQFDHGALRAAIGSGEKDWQRACSAMRRWAMFDTPGVEMFSPDTPVEVGQRVAVLGSFAGLWVKNACVIEQLLGDGDGLKRFGFRYVTLPVHIACGDEIFAITYDPKDEQVYYSIEAWARPRHLWSSCVYSVVRHLQARFRRESIAAMRRAVHGDGDGERAIARG